MTKVIGVTGGIATGKSTVTSILRDLDCHVIDADAVVHEMQKPEGKLYHLIMEHFGSEFFDAHGDLNRKKLGKAIFSDPQSYQKLSDIQNELIREELLKLLEVAIQAQKSIVFMDIPLLFEGNYEHICDEVWLITASQEIQISRLEKRSQMTRDEALSRIQQQMPQEEKIARADVIIDNSASLEDLKRKILDQLSKVKL